MSQVNSIANLLYVFFIIENMPPANSKNKQPRYELSEKQRETIKSDSHNTKLWMEILSFADSAGSVSSIIFAWWLHT